MDPCALASMEGQKVTHTDEIERRLVEIRADPVLSRRLDALRRGIASRVPITERLERMRRDKIEEIARGRVLGN